VVSLVQGSAAEKTGRIQEGDLLLAVDSQEVSVPACPWFLSVFMCMSICRANKKRKENRNR
jgi:hypothetical protein